MCRWVCRGCMSSARGCNASCSNPTPSPPPPFPSPSWKLSSPLPLAMPGQLTGGRQAAKPASSHRQRVEADTLSPQNEQDARAGSSSSSCIAIRRRRPPQPPAPPSPPLPLPWLPRPRPIGQCQAKPNPLVQPSPRTVPMAIPPTLDGPRAR